MGKSFEADKPGRPVKKGQGRRKAGRRKKKTDRNHRAGLWNNVPKRRGNPKDEPTSIRRGTSPGKGSEGRGGQQRASCPRGGSSKWVVPKGDKNTLKVVCRGTGHEATKREGRRTRLASYS